jgi:hypothetical protein
MPLKEPSNKTRILWNLLTDQALSYFEHNLKKKNIKVQEEMCTFFNIYVV